MAETAFTVPDNPINDVWMTCHGCGCRSGDVQQRRLQAADRSITTRSVPISSPVECHSKLERRSDLSRTLRANLTKTTSWTEFRALPGQVVDRARLIPFPV